MNLDKKKILHLIEYNNRNKQQILMESFIDIDELLKYNHRFNEQTLLFNDITLLTELSNKEVIDLIDNNSFDVNKISEFKNALNLGSKGEFLSDYTEDDYGKMRTYKVKGYDVGFAIKEDGDIVSIFNNSGFQ
jgi:GH15 family glucan-1,4-alpha-glucosidase